ncbi:MAG: hypothetical protein ACLQO6_07755, partial [Desulfomonilaceae bacterium]
MLHKFVRMLCALMFWGFWGKKGVRSELKRGHDRGIEREMTGPQVVHRTAGRGESSELEAHLEHLAVVEHRLYAE